MPEDSSLEYLENALPGFLQARQLIKSRNDSIQSFGWFGNKQEWYQLVNRFRMAASFRSLHLDGFSSETETGYAGLTRIFLVWSAFERYAELCQERAPYANLLRYYPRAKVHELAAQCRSLDPQHCLTDFLIQEANIPAQADFLRNYKSGHDLSVFTLAAHLRHIFAHGFLAANANGLGALKLAELCHAIADFIIEFIRKDFHRRLQLAIHSS